MPSFPTPSSQVPSCLNPLNLRHCCLVAYWVYCCPTALKYYLYRASPTLYKASTGGAILKTLNVRAYRNLYLCLPLTITLLSSGLSLLALLLLPVASFSWTHWFLGLCVGNSIGIIFLIIFGLTFSFTASTARGAASGTIVSVVAGVANATVLAVVLGYAPDWSYAQLLTPTNFSLVVLFGLWLGTAIALMIGGLIGGLIGIVSGIACGVITGSVFGIIKTAVDQVEISGLVYATIVGLATSGAFGASMTMASALVFCLVLGIVVGISVDLSLYQYGLPLEKAIIYGVFSTGIIWMGTLRLMPFHICYLLYSVLSTWPGFKFNQHPIIWDELLILPLPGTRKYLERAMQQNEPMGFQRLLQAARNPFQRPILQQNLKKYIFQKENVLETIYRFLAHPCGNAYIFAPVDTYDWQQLPTSKEVLLGELSDQWVNCTAELTSYRIERFVYGLTWLRRNHTRNGYTAFCQLLYDMSYRFASEGKAHSFDLSSYAATYSALSTQTGGVEISESLTAMADFLSYTHINQLPGATQQANALPPVSKAIRPDVVEIINRLKRISSDISTAEESNSLFVRQASLLRTNSSLESLRQHVIDEVISPERKLLKAIIEQWIHFVVAAGGKAGALTEHRSFLKNPYIIGTPVIGEALVGRSDILRRIADELFASPGSCPSIVLYGHRRMGKSSILRNLDSYLPSSKIKVVDFNMQILGHISDTGELLYALARQIYRALPPNQSKRLEALDRNEFMGQNPYHALNDFFQTLNVMLKGQSFIIAIDEFEKIEEKIEKLQLSENLLEFLRGLTQTYSWFSLIFAGLHTLEEMCYSYWHPFFTSIPIRVSFLQSEEAKRLILQADHMAYEDDVVEEIVQLTNGQPYLVQLIGHTLITYFNRDLLESRTMNSEYLVFNSKDLKTILESTEFYTIGNAYFKGIWLQALNGQVGGQIDILQNLARQSMTAEQLAKATGFRIRIVEDALNALQAHDVVTYQAGCFTYTVPLMRMWVASHQL